MFITHGEYLEQKDKEKDMGFIEKNKLELIDKDPKVMDFYKSPQGKYYLHIVYLDDPVWVTFKKEAQPYLKETTEEQMFDTMASLYEMHETGLSVMQDHFIRVFE